MMIPPLTVISERCILGLSSIKLSEGVFINPTDSVLKRSWFGKSGYGEGLRWQAPELMGELRDGYYLSRL